MSYLTVGLGLAICYKYRVKSLVICCYYYSRVKSLVISYMLLI